MASMFMVPPKPKSTPMKRQNPEEAKAIMNKERLRASGSSYSSTVLASGLKPNTGA